MPDAPFSPIVLDPSTTAVSGPMTGLPPIQQSAAQTVPLQPIPRAVPSSTAAPATVVPQQPAVATPPAMATPAPVAPTSTSKRQTELHQQLETLSQEENKLLGTMKDWIAWIQGAETKKQAIERELATLNNQFNLDSTAATRPTLQTPAAPVLDQAALEKQLREAEAKLKTIADQQKIEEKKAFDNYSAGGINRDGLLQEMDRISKFYAAPRDAAKATVTALQTQLAPTAAVPANPTTIPAPAPTPAPAATPIPAAPIPAATPNQQKILERLRTLTAAQSGYIKQLLVDVPAQGINLTIERAADGNGIIILAGTEQAYSLGHHFPDADLILAGLGGDDIVTLPTGTLTGTQITPPATVSL